MSTLNCESWLPLWVVVILKTIRWFLLCWWLHSMDAEWVSLCCNFAEHLNIAFSWAVLWRFLLKVLHFDCDGNETCTMLSQTVRLYSSCNYIENSSRNTRLFFEMFASLLQLFTLFWVCVRHKCENGSNCMKLMLNSGRCGVERKFLNEQPYYLLRMHCSGLYLVDRIDSENFSHASRKLRCDESKLMLRS